MLDWVRFGSTWGALVLGVAAMATVRTQPKLGLLLFFIAGLSLVFSAGRGTWERSDLDSPETSWRPWEKWFLLGLAVFGFLSRSYLLGTVPAGANGAEGQIASALNRLENLDRYVPHWGGDISFPTLTYYQSLICAHLFGWEPGSLRLPSVLWGVLLLPLFYLLARRMASPESALIGTLLLSADQYTFLMSRMLFPGIITMIAPVGGFYFLLKGLGSAKFLDFAIGGALAGLSLHSYVPGHSLLDITTISCGGPKTLRFSIP